MATASAFERQLTLVPPRILGRRLAPFTLGHAHLLETAKSPFMGGGGGKVDLADLVLAAWICGFPRYRKARAACVSAMRGSIPRNVRRWGRKVGLSFKLEEEVERMAAFVNDSTKPPPSMRRKDSKPLATPAAATLAVLHRHYFATPPAAVMDVPFLDALIDVLVWHHAQGKIELLDEKKVAFIEEVSRRKPPQTKKAGSR